MLIHLKMQKLLPLKPDELYTLTYGGSLVGGQLNATQPIFPYHTIENVYNSLADNFSTDQMP